MKTKSIAILLAALIMALVVCCSAVSAGIPVPPSNETSALSVEITASAIGKLTSNTDMTFTQGNGNLADNPPLDANGEGQATIGYFEDTVATSGSIYYTKNLYLDTSSPNQGSDNLLVVRDIDYTNDGDGNGAGMLYSTEAVMIDECATGSTAGDAGCCQWPTDEPVDLPASCVYVMSGSDVLLKEGAVTSVSSASTVNDDIDAGIQLAYDVTVDGSGQTGAATAEGKATVYTEAIIKEGSGNATNMTTDVSYTESVTVDGLIEIAMKTGYSSP
jgi:hypothetical protein